MKRRNALRLTAVLMGGTIVGSDVFLSGCTNAPTTKALFTDKDIALLDEIGETILPETKESPGARAAKIGDFMKTIVTDCYSEKEQTVFLDGLAGINALAEKSFGGEFSSLGTEDKIAFLNGLDKEARATPEGQLHYFGLMKQLTIWGYFTSEPGATQALRYNPVPGRYIGCIPYKTGDRAWAE